MLLRKKDLNFVNHDAILWSEFAERPEVTYLSAFRLRDVAGFMSIRRRERSGARRQKDLMTLQALRRARTDSATKGMQGRGWYIPKWAV